MSISLETIALKNGRDVSPLIVTGPDLEWADRMDDLLGHKGETYQWQNREAMRRETGLEARYYVLAADSIPFANISVFEGCGVGVLGHVFTKPDQRGNGAASALMSLAMNDFKTRGGKALFLGTGYGSQAYRIYQAHGFRGIAPQSGLMEFYTGPRDAFEDAFFDANDCAPGPPGWADWPLMEPLMHADIPGVIRSMRMGILGRGSVEGGLLPILREQQALEPESGTPTCLVLRSQSSGAVPAVACWCWHRVWPRTCVLDLFSHPRYWESAEELVVDLKCPEADRTIAYVDEQTPEKATVLEKAGFHATVTHRRRVAIDTTRTDYVDVTEYERRG